MSLDTPIAIASPEVLEERFTDIQCNFHEAMHLKALLLNLAGQTLPLRELVTLLAVAIDEYTIRMSSQLQALVITRAPFYLELLLEDRAQLPLAVATWNDMISSTDDAVA